VPTNLSDDTTLSESQETKTAKIDIAEKINNPKKIFFINIPP
jgi:hypothetical protein